MSQKKFLIDGGFQTNAESVIGGNLLMSGSIIPSVNSDGLTGYDLGAPDKKWRDLYLSQGSLYIDGQKVLQSESGTIVVSADQNQSMTVKTTGTGVLTLASDLTVNFAATLQMATGKKITDAGGNAVIFGDKIDMDNNQIINVANPTQSGHAATKGYVDSAFNSILNGVPAALDTLNELADALNNDANFAATVTSALATKATITYVDSSITSAITAAVASAKTYTDGEVATLDAQLKTYTDTAVANVDVSAELATVTSAYQLADTQLQSDLDEEVTDRQTAVTAANTARVAADANLQTQISTNTTAIANILSNIDPEALDSLTEIVGAFQSADDTINGAIISLSTAAATDRAAIRTEFAAADASITTAYTSAIATKASITYVDSKDTAQSTALNTATSTLQSDISTKLAASAYTAADVLTKIKTVDGAGSGLDADLLDGQSSAYYATAASVTAEASARAAADTAEINARNAAITTAMNSLVNFHGSVYTVNAAMQTANVTGTVNVTFADLATAKHYTVYLNRWVLRPILEYTVSGTTITFVTGLLSNDDEIEVAGLKV